VAQCFPKSEKLCGAMRIASFYKNGSRMVCWPLRVTYLPSDETQVLIWAPKALFKHAVDRNKLRRLMREAWRLHKDDLEGKWTIAFNYMDKQIQDYKTIEHGIKRTIHKLNENTPA